MSLGRPPAMFSERSKVPVVPQGAEIDDRAIVERKPARRGAGGEKKFLEGVNAPLVVRHDLLGRVEGPGLPAQMKGNVLFLRTAPDFFQRLTLPEAFGERGAVIGWILLGADQAHGPVGIGFADTVHGRIGGHSTAHDQVLVVWHIASSWWTHP